VGTTDMEQMLVAKDKGAPIDLAPVSPVIATAFGLYVPPGAPHPAAAELLAAWLVTPAAEHALEKVSYYALATPCSASRMAGMFCAKHVTIEHLGSLANIRKDPAYLKSIEQALGTYQGK
jgi:iron(III) transport system substrate-binding protein